MTGRTGIVELADPLTWPEAIRGLVSAQPAWSGTDSASDLEVYYDPGAVVAALDGYRLRAFHATRLLDQEVQEVRAKGLRRLGPELVKDRLAGAVAVGALTKEEARYYAAHHLARSPDTHEAVRVGQVCLVAGRTWLDYAEGKCGSQLAYWGGEVLDFPLDRQSISSRRLGRPTIVVADLALAAEDLRSGYEEGWLVKAFVAVHVGLGGDQTMATVNYRSADIPPAEIVAIWRPGDPCYDRHPNLPTDCRRPPPGAERRCLRVHSRHERPPALSAANGHPHAHRRCFDGLHPTQHGTDLASIRREMDVPEQVEAYLASQPEPKQADLRRLHAHMLAEFPECRLWFNDGTNADGKVVANPNIGYGAYTITYADGSSREFYRIGLSANTTGISVYVLGLDDKTYLARTYGASIGKANVTGYCIKFRHLAVINADVLQAAIRHGMTVHQGG